MPRLAIAIALLLGAALDACCPVTSLHPLGNPQEAVYDTRLTGAWHGAASENDVGIIHIGKGPGNQTQVLVVAHKKDGQMEQIAFPVFIDRIQENYYMNIHLQQLEMKEAKAYQGYVLLQYRLPDADTLILSQIDEKVLADAINAKRITGEITYEDESPAAAKDKTHEKKIECVRTTDTMENLRKFVASKNNEQLFVPYMTLKRLSP